VPADGAGATVERFNGFARSRPSTRTSTAATRPTTATTATRATSPTRASAPLDKAPFYAVKIVPGDLGTKGGLRTDERARVLREDGTVIPGPVRGGQRQRGR
jgi:3-oxosteroid 1-dehydrogenase